MEPRQLSDYSVWLLWGGLGIESWGHKNLCRCREPSDYVSLCRAVETQQFHTLNTHDTKPRTHQHSLQTPYMLELDLGPFPPDVAHSFPPVWCLLYV